MGSFPGIEFTWKAPVGVPDRTRIVPVHRREDEFHRFVAVVIAGNSAGQQRFGPGIARVVLLEVRPALAVSFHQRAHNTEAGALPIQILAVARTRAVRDDAFDVPFIHVEQESNKRLLIIGIAARIGLNDQTQAPLRARRI